MPDRWVILVILMLGTCTSSATSSAQETAQRAGDKFQNVTVLREMPADQMGKVMNIMSEALGVSCTHCHAGYDFAREGVPHKDSSRRMLEMTLKINQDAFGGKTVISCVTCHQGKSKVPDATLSATLFTTTMTAAAVSGPSPTVQPNAPLRSTPDTSVARNNEINLQSPADDRAESMLKRYRQIVGIDRAREPKVTSIKGVPKTNRYQGKRLEPSGKEEVEVIQITSPTTWEQVTHYGQLTVTERYVDGMIVKQAGDRTIELKLEEQSQIRIEARLALGLELQNQFTDWHIEPTATKIDDRPVQVLRAREADMTHHFMFDEQSGLLRRRTTTVPTVLGGYVIQVDYEEYREIEGWPVASLTSVRMPSVRWQRRLESF